jgi:hypothetical protein
MVILVQFYFHQILYDNLILIHMPPDWFLSMLCRFRIWSWATASCVDRGQSETWSKQTSKLCNFVSKVKGFSLLLYCYVPIKLFVALLPLVILTLGKPKNSSSACSVAVTHIYREDSSRVTTPHSWLGLFIQHLSMLCSFRIWSWVTASCADRG